MATPPTTPTTCSKYLPLCFVPHAAAVPRIALSLCFSAFPPSSTQSTHTATEQRQERHTQSIHIHTHPSRLSLTLHLTLQYVRLHQLRQRMPPTIRQYTQDIHEIGQSQSLDQRTEHKHWTSNTTRQTRAFNATLHSHRRQTPEPDTRDTRTRTRTPGPFLPNRDRITAALALLG